MDGLHVLEGSVEWDDAVWTYSSVPDEDELDSYTRDDLIDKVKNLSRLLVKRTDTILHLCGSESSFDSDEALKAHVANIRTTCVGPLVGPGHQAACTMYSLESDKSAYRTIDPESRTELSTLDSIAAIKNNPMLYSKSMPATLRRVKPIAYVAVSRNARNYCSVPRDLRRSEVDLAKIAVTGIVMFGGMMAIDLVEIPETIRETPDFYKFAFRFWAGEILEINHSPAVLRQLWNGIQSARDDIEIARRYVDVWPGITYSLLPLEFKKDEEIVTRALSRGTDREELVDEVFANEQLVCRLVRRDSRIFLNYDEKRTGPVTQEVLRALYYTLRSNQNAKDLVELCFNTDPPDLAVDCKAKYDKLSISWDNASLFEFPLCWLENREIFTDVLRHVSVVRQLAAICCEVASRIDKADPPNASPLSLFRRELGRPNGWLKWNIEVDVSNEDSLRWLTLIQHADDLLFGSAERMQCTVNESTLPWSNRNSLWNIACIKFPDADELAFEASKDFERYSTDQGKFWSSMKAPSRARLMRDNDFLSKLLEHAPCVLSHAEPVMLEPTMALKVAKALSSVGLLEEMMANFPRPLYKNYAFRNFMLSSTMQANVVVIMLQSTTLGLASEVERADFAIRVLSDNAVPIHVRQAAYRRLPSLPKNDYTVARTAMYLFGEDDESAITDPVEARLLKIAAKNHMDTDLRKEMEERDRDRAGPIPAEETDDAFLRSLLYDICRYFSPEAAYSIAKEKLRVKRPKVYKQVLSFPEESVLLESLKNDFVDEEEEEEDTTEDPGVDSPLGMKAILNMLERYAFAASQVFRTDARIGAYNGAVEVSESYEGLSVRWLRSDATGALELTTKSGRPISLPEDLEFKMPTFELEGTLWAGYEQPKRVVNAASRKENPTLETYAGIKLVVSKVSSSHPELATVEYKRSLGFQMSLVEAFNDNLLDGPESAFVIPSNVQPYESDEQVQAFQHQVEQRGGAGVKTLNDKNATTNIDRHNYKLYSKRITDFLEKWPLAILRTVEMSDGSRTFKVAAESLATSMRDVGKTQEQLDEEATKRQKVNKGKRNQTGAGGGGRRTAEPKRKGKIAVAAAAAAASAAAAAGSTDVAASSSAAGMAYAEAAFEDNSDSDDDENMHPMDWVASSDEDEDDESMRSSSSDEDEDVDESSDDDE